MSLTDMRQGPWGEGCLVGAQGSGFSSTLRTQRDQLWDEVLNPPAICPTCRPAPPQGRSLTRPKIQGLGVSRQHQASQNQPRRGSQEKELRDCSLLKSSPRGGCIPETP